MVTRCSEALASVAPHLFENIGRDDVGAAIFAAHEVEGRIIFRNGGKERVRGVDVVRPIRLTARKSQRDKNIPCGETEQRGHSEKIGY